MISRFMALFPKVFTFFQDLWTAAYNLPEDQRKRTVKIAAWAGVVVVLIVLFCAGETAGKVVPAEHPVWEAVILARMALVRLVLAVPLLAIGILAAVGLYQVFENSDLGKRQVVWSKSDDAYTQAAKTRNGGLILSSLIIACVLGLLFGVLR